MPVARSSPSATTSRSRRVRSTSDITTFMPVRANACAMPRPIPLAAPVTTATRSFSSSIGVVCQSAFASVAPGRERVIVHAVRGHDGAPRVVEIDEPPGRGEVITMRAAGICASDLGYLALGTEKILGHELAGVRADGTAVAVEGLFGCGQCDYCQSGR